MGRLVFSYPARRNYRENPYNKLLSDALEVRGWQVVDPTVRQALGTSSDIVHVHWPQQFASAAGKAFLRRTILFLLMLIGQRRRGSKLVWTIHNVRSHRQRRPGLERFVMTVFVRLLDGFLYFNEASRRSAEEAYPRLRRLPCRLISHGVYGDAYPETSNRAVARAALGIASDAEVLGIIGDVRPYKGVDQMLANLEKGPIVAELLLAGSIPSDAYGDRVRAAILALQVAGWQVHLVDERLGNEQLVQALAASSVAVFPYRTRSPSGMAVLAAERGCVILGPWTDPFSVLAAHLGHEGILQCDDFDYRAVSQALKIAREQPDPTSRIARLRKGNSWIEIAGVVESLYMQLLTCQLPSGVNRTPCKN